MQDILLDYPTGRLALPVRAALEKHLAVCAACRDAVEQQSAVWHALDAWEPAPLSMDFNRRLWQRIDRMEEQPWYTGLVNWKPLLPAAVAALMVIAAGLVFFNPHNESPIQSVAGVADVSLTEVDQAEATLDDLQLLQQLDSVTTPDSDVDSRI